MPRRYIFWAHCTVFVYEHEWKWADLKSHYEWLQDADDANVEPELKELSGSKRYIVAFC